MFLNHTNFCYLQNPIFHYNSMVKNFNFVYRLTLLFAGLFFVLSVSAQTPAQTPQGNSSSESLYDEGKLFVKLTHKLDLDFAYNCEKPGEFSNKELKRIIEFYGITSIACPFKAKDDGLLRTFVIEFSKTEKAAALIKSFSRLEYIEYAEKIPLYKPFYTPNDLDPNQWNLQAIDAQNAWNIQQGTNTVVVAVTDDAVALTHPDLAANIWVNPGEIPGDGIDNDGNGYIDDINGWDAADNDNDPNPPAIANANTFSHGTHVSGIVGAVTDNNIGIASIGFNVRLMAVKASPSAGMGGTLPAAYQAVDYAIATDADVISMSWGGGAYAATYQALFALANAQGIVNVAAAGNSNTAAPMYPASYDYVISVGATNITDARASFSNYGPNIDVMAPGKDIWSTVVGPGYGYKSGTSMACPLVSGLVSLMLSQNPAMTPQDVEDCLENTCDNIDVQNPGYIGQIGAGRINAFQALQCASSIYAEFTADYTFVCPGGSVQFTDLSTNNPTNWSWSFPGGIPAISNLQNPMVTYPVAGNYTVSLTATNANGNDTEIKTGYITVALPSASLTGGATVLVGFPAFLTVNFVGNPPWSFVYTDGVSSFPVTGITQNPYFFPVYPTSPTSYSLVSMSDASCGGTVSGTALVDVIDPSASSGCVYTNLYGDGNDQGLYDVFYDIANDEIFACGRSGPNGLLSKYDALGNLMWAKEYNNVNVPYTKVVGAPNGDLLMIANPNEDILVTRVDPNGTVIWTRVISNNRERFPMMIKSTGDSYIIGTWYSGGGSSDDIGLIRIDGSGNIIWSNRYDNIDDQLYDICSNGAGGAVCVGGLHGGGVDAFITEIDVNGNIVLAREFEMPNNYWLETGRIIPTIDGKYAIFINYNNAQMGSPWEAGLLKVDASFNLEWSQALIDPGMENRFSGLTQDLHGNFYLDYRSDYGGNGLRPTILQFDSLGNFKKGKSFLDNNGGKILATGSAPVDNLLIWDGPVNYPGGFGAQDIFLARLDTSLNSCAATDITPVFSSMTYNNVAWPLTPAALGFSNFVGAVTDVPLNYSRTVLCDSCGGLNAMCLVVDTFQKISDIQGNFLGLLDDGDQFGQEIGPLGDFNGDGIPDLIVSVPSDDDGGNDKGAIYLVFLNSNGTVISHQKISETQGGFTGSLYANGRFGGGVTTIGDLNGDGVIDLAVTEPYCSDGGFQKGAVWILFMNANGTVNSEQKISNTAGNFLAPMPVGQRFGSFVASVGDLNNDGVTDIAVGAGYDDDGGTDRGAVFILFLNANGTVNNYQKISDTQGGLTANLSNSDYFGFAGDAIGDFNGDGTIDLIIGARLDDDGGTNRGAVYILYLNPNGTANGHNKISHTQGNLPPVLDDNDRFGVGVKVVGDVNQDGVNDIFVGADFDDDGGSYSGAGYLLFLSNTGNVSGYLKVGGLTPGFSGALSANSIAGYGISGVGDVNGDGVIDLVLGAMGDDDGGLNRGAAYIIFLKDSCETVPDCHLNPNFSHSSITCIGDTTWFNDLSTDSLANPIFWQWYFGDGDSLWGTPNPGHVYALPGTYNVTLIVTDDAIPSCKDTVTLPVTITAGSITAISPGDTICLGDSVQINAYAWCAPGPYSYQWAPGTWINNTTISNPIVSPPVTTTYTVTITNLATGQAFNHQVQIVVNAGCCISWAGFEVSDTTICLGDTAWFTNLSVPNGANPNFQWDFGPNANPATWIGPNPPFVIFNTAGTETVQLVLTDACGTDTAELDVFIIPLPIANTGNDTALCLPDTLQIGDISVAYFSYLWIPGSGLSDSTLSDPIAVIDSAITYYLRVEDEVMGCVSYDSIRIDSLPTPGVDLGPDWVICPGNNVILTPTTANDTSRVWQDGSSGLTFTANAPGTYWVTVFGLCGSATDTIEIISESFPTVGLPNDTLLCAGDDVLLNPIQTFVNGYLWQDNSTDSTFLATGPGIYWVEVSNLCGTDRDSITIGLAPEAEVTLPPDASLCPGTTLMVSPFSLTATSYVWQDGSTSIPYLISAAGVYWLEATTVCGADRDSISITSQGIPTVNLGQDQGICPGDTLLLSPTATLEDGFTWYDGTTGTTHVITQPGTYWLEAFNDCGIAYDTIQVISNPNPVVVLPPDLQLCQGDSFEIIPVVFVGNFYVWSGGLNTPTIWVNTPGTYWLQTANSCGIVRDSVIISYDSLLSLNLGPDSVVCQGQTVTLDASLPGATYLWQDGSTQAQLSFSTGGVYWVQVTTPCGTNSDTVIYTLAQFLTPNLGPDSTVCAGDSVELNPGGFSSYLWSDGSTQPTLTVTVDGSYWVVASDSNACEGSDTIDVEFVYCPQVIYIPNAFTPNGDGLNDLFAPVENGVTVTLIQVFDRWGALVFESYSAQNGWDGKFHGKLVQEGVYTWRIGFRFNNGAEDRLHGTVTLIR